MRFKNPKNKKSKLHIKFDENDRRDYLLGFRKRKLERKEKAKLQMAEMMKKEKKEIKKKRIELINKMIGASSTNPFDDDSDEEEEEETPTNNVEEAAITEYDNCTVEVSNLDLDNKFALGPKKNTTVTKGASGSKDDSEEGSTPLFKVPLEKVTTKKFKSSVWKSASKKAKKSFEFDKRNKKKKKKKILVTEL
ncbi:UNVERIFIED_CONTAM: hypothetical protein RMT77_015779 [Armadillidium vulgare]